MTQNKRRRIAKRRQPDLFSLLETPRQKTQRVAAAGNSATRTIRKWIRSDPASVAACCDLAQGVLRIPLQPGVTKAQAAALRREELAQQLKVWFRRAVRKDEPSANYADYLCGSIDVQWWMLAEEMLDGEWLQGS